jgi:hypothetical protein
MGVSGTRTVTEVKNRELTDLTPKLKSVVKDILAIDPTLPPAVRADGSVISRTDRIRALYKRLSDESFPPAGQKPSESNLQAQSLAATLKNILKSPSNNNPEFLAAWAKANGMAEARFLTREALAVVDAVNTHTPSQIVDNLIVNKPKSIDNLIAIRRATDHNTFQDIRSAFHAKLLRSPGTIDEVMDGFEPNVLGMLMPSAERKVMRTAAKQYKNLMSANIEQFAKKQSDVGAFIREVVGTKSTASINQIRELVMAQPGGLRSPYGKSVTAGVIDEAIRLSQKSTKMVDTVSGEVVDVMRLNGGLLQKTLADFKEKGLLRLVPQDTLNVLKDVKAVQLYVDKAAEDVGASLMGAGVARGVTQLSIDAIGNLIHLMGTGYVLTNPVASKMILATTHAPPKSRTQALQIISAMFASMATEANESDRQGDDIARVLGIAAQSAKDRVVGDVSP